MDRQSSLLSDHLVELLVKQVEHEVYNAHLYRTFASWCDANGLKNSTKIFNEQYEEEQGHAKQIWEYIQDCGVFVPFPKVDQIKVDEIDSDGKEIFKKLFELSLEREILTTEDLKAIAKAALDEGDYITFIFLKELLLNQVTEEKEAHDRLDAFKHTTDNLIVDHYLE